MIELDRGGLKSPRIAVPVWDPEVSEQVSRAFSDKYGATDWIVALSGDASKRVVVRLDVSGFGSIPTSELGNAATTVSAVRCS